MLNPESVIDINLELVNKIRYVIADLEREYQECQGLILSEDDLKCNLFRKIYPLFLAPEKKSIKENTMDDGVFGSPLHAEIKFYDEKD